MKLEKSSNHPHRASVRPLRRESSRILTRSMYQVRSTMMLVVIRLVDLLSAVYARVSLPPESRTTSMALCIHRECLVAYGHANHLLPHLPFAMRIPMALRRAISSGMGTCPFGGQAVVLPGLMAMSTSHNSCLEKIQSSV